MRLYLIIYDATRKYVEAPGLAAAVLLWREAVKKEWDKEFDGTEEPESIELISREAVVSIDERFGDENWCENAAACGKLGTVTDNEGVHLCAECMAELKRQADPGVEE